MYMVLFQLLETPYYLQFFYIINMEYQQKKEQILSSVQFSNLLSFNLVENKLERNFRAIVEAVILSQGKADEAINRADQLDDRITIDRQKTVQEQDGLKQIVKQLNQRVSKLENQANASKLPVRVDSSKEVKQSQKTEISRKDILQGEPGLYQEKNSYLQKKLDDAFHQISNLKDKMPTLKLMQTQLDAMKRELALIKGELLSVGKSAKSIKRQSTNPPTQLFKRESISKTPKGLPHSNSSILLKDTENKQNKSQHVEAKQIVNRLDTNASNLNSAGDQDFQRQIEGLHIQVNTLNLCYDQLRHLVEDLRKKDIKYHSTLSELEDRQKRMQDQMRRDSENFEKTIKSLHLDILNIQSSPSSGGSKPQTEQKGSKSDIQEGGKKQKEKDSSSNSSQSNLQDHEQNNMNFKNQINDKLSKLQNSLLGFITENQFNRFKGETRGKLEQIQKKHDKLVNEYEEEIRKIYDMFINKDLDMNRLGEQLNSAFDSIKENHSQAERKHNIAIARVEELKKNLQNLRQDVQFYQAMNTENKQSKQKKVQQGKTVDSNQPKKEGSVDGKALEELKKYFNNKLHDQRAYLVGLIRDLEKKQNSASGINQQIANLWDKINEFNVFVNKKADAEDIKKNLLYLEKKINKISAQIIKTEDNTEDARVAKTSWFCLSCDKNLLGYQGKVGKHVIWDSMPLKGVVKTVEKKGLPYLKK